MSQPCKRLKLSTPELRAQLNLTNDHQKKYHTCKDVLLPVKSCENGCSQSLEKNGTIVDVASSYAYR